MTHENPRLPWFEQKLRARAQDFELVLKSRFPSVHDRQTRAWGKVLGQAAAWERWERQDYADPRLLRKIRKLARITPDDSQAYGHLRPPGRAKAKGDLGGIPHWLTLPRISRQARSSICGLISAYLPASTVTAGSSEPTAQSWPSDPAMSGK